MEDLAKILHEVKKINPLVFHITNAVTINDCANITLSVGASPLMSFCKEELDEVLSFSSSLVINIGTMDKFMQDMVIEAGKKANSLNVPVVLDPVGVGATSVRKKLVQKLLNEVTFAVIKGNSAEIKTLLGLELEKNAGVDSKEDFSDEKSIQKLAKSLNTVIAMSGKTDIISDGEQIAKVQNGTSLLSKVSGTGCMSASLIASCCGANRDFFKCAILGISLMGISGEMAQDDGISTNGRLKGAILDNISNISKSIFLNRVNIQIQKD